MKITQEDTIFYDGNKEREVEECISNNINKCQPYNTSDITRLAGNTEIDTLISDIEIRYTINTFKNNTPGETKIKKLIMKKRPDSGITV